MLALGAEPFTRSRLEINQPLSASTVDPSHFAE